jgi:glycosyltransferase involved in cell wall biosynthesis
VSLRICFVTPFAWSQPHEVNTHVDGAAAALRRLGHEVTVLAPSSRARDLVAGRRALQRGTHDAEVIAIGPSIPLSRRTNMGVPVAVRANLRLALTRGRFDIVHGFEPGLPSLSYLALTSTHALTAATFFSVDRLAYPARRSRRDRLRTRVDALLATSGETAEAAAERFEGDYAVIPVGVDLASFRAAGKRDLVAIELEASGRATTRALLRLLESAPEWEAALLHTKPLGFRPAIPRRLRSRVHVRSTRTSAQRAEALAPAAIFVSAPGGEERLALEAAACEAAHVDGSDDGAEREVERLVGDAAARAAAARDARTHA